MIEANLGTVIRIKTTVAQYDELVRKVLKRALSVFLAIVHDTPATPTCLTVVVCVGASLRVRFLNSPEPVELTHGG